MIAVCIRVRSVHVGVTPGCGVEVSLNPAGKTSGPIFVSTKPAQPEWINSKVIVEGNHPFEVSVKVGRAKARAVPGDPLIKSKVKADRLLSAQRRVAKPPQPEARESSLPKSFEQRRRAKTVAHVRPKFSLRGTKEVGHRAITCQRSFGFNRTERTGTVRRANTEVLPARSDRNLQTIVQQEDLVLAEDGERALAIGGVVDRAKGWN